MTMKSLSQMRAIMKEPQLLHKWQIEIPTWPAVGGPANPNILFLITTSSLPTGEKTDVQVELAGLKMNYNGKTDRNGEIEWLVYENTDQEVTNYFTKTYANARQNYNSSSDVSIKARDTKDLIAPIVNMNLFDAAGERITKTYQLLNCMFHVTQPGEGLGQEATAQQITIAVSYDGWVLK